MEIFIVGDIMIMDNLELEIIKIKINQLNIWKINIFLFLFVEEIIIQLD